MKYVANAFSLGMLKDDATLEVRNVDIEDAKEFIKENFVSCIGHPATATILSSLIEKEIEVNRIPITLEKGDEVLVFQLLKRLEEGRVLREEEILTIPYKFFIIKVK